MPQHDRPNSNHAGQPHDDLEQIAGIGPALARRLYGAGIVTFQDLAERTPQEITAILTNTARVSPERIANWTSQARQLAGPPPLPEPSEPSQHYASFHVEFLLDPDNSVRRTKVHHHQTDTDDTWPGSDDDRLLTFLRDRIPPAPTPPPSEAVDLQPPPAPSTSQPPPATPSPSLSPSLLRIEELAPIRNGQTGYIRHPDEPTSVRLTLHIAPTGGSHAAALDFTADIAARSKLGDNRRWHLGTTRGAIRGNEPVSVEVTGRPLPPGLYRLVATVAIYPADGTPEAPPLFSRDVSGDLLQVGDAPTQTAPAGDLTSSNS